MRETKYRAYLIGKLETLLPGCVVLKNDPSHIQGIPDILVLYKRYWAALEIKKSAKAESQPNQEYWVDRLDDLAFSAFIYPENEEEVLNALQHAFGLS